MKLTNLLLLFLFLGCSAMAQEKARYTFVTDKVFHQAAELYGYTLIPNEWEDASGSHGKLSPGEVSFSIFRGYLVVKGTKSAGSYSINRISKEGRNVFKVSTLDPKDPSRQGSLKVILDDNNNIDAYIFRQSRNHDEVIYYQAGYTMQEKNKQEKVFTDKNEMVLVEDAEIWGSVIRPFFVINRSKTARVYGADNVAIEFVETIEIKEPSPQLIARQTKKEQKKAEKVKAKPASPFDDELDELEDDETDADYFHQTATPEAAEEMEEPVEEKAKKEKAPKEKRTYSIVYTYNDGGAGAKRQTAVVKKWSRLMSKTPSKNARSVIKFDTNAGDVIVYLNDNDAVSAVEIDNNRYLMRGY